MLDLFTKKQKTMKYIITGGAGNISRPLSEKLLAAGHDVTVISRNPRNIEGLVNLGAKAAIGSFEDADFLSKTFRGADVVYTMVTPPFHITDMKMYYEQIGKNYIRAIQDAGIKYVASLSSVGAHLPEGCGPVSGLYRVEQSMNTLTDVHIRHFRPVYFYANFFGNIEMIRHMNIIGANFGGPGFVMPLADTGDIADVIYEELTGLDFSGHTYRYIASDEKTTDEIAKILGAAIGKPELPWVVFTDEQAYQGMKQAGLPEEFAKNYTEMGHAVQDGTMMADYFDNRPSVMGKTKLEDFAEKFAGIYKASPAS